MRVTGRLLDPVATYSEGRCGSGRLRYRPSDGRKMICKRICSGTAFVGLVGVSGTPWNTGSGPHVPVAVAALGGAR